jgi:antitoxin component YwqK of YwqJK toxin-antitoxin module
MNKPQLFLILFCTLFFIAGCTKVKREYHKNGKVISETHYRCGKETGTTVHYHFWYPTKIMEVEMKRGKKHGKFTKRYFDNSLESTAFYKNDLLEGVETHYYKNGNRSSEIHYTKGVKNGPMTTWHFNGVVKESGAFVNGLYDGEWENYDDRGMLVGEGSFVNGTGQRIVYDVMGRMLTETNFINNKKEGLEIHFLPSGEVEKTYLFKEDRIIEINGVSVEEL